MSNIHIILTMKNFSKEFIYISQNNQYNYTDYDL